MTSPRRATNQRLTKVAPRTSATTPLPVPTTTPQSSMSCHGRVMKTVNPTPAARKQSAAASVRRTPTRSMTAAANGPISPYRTRLIDTAPAIVARDHPNASSSGTMSTPGVARMAAATSSVTKVTAATIQA